MEINKLWNNDMNAYHENFSTVTALINIMETWTKNIDEYYYQKTPLNAFGDITTEREEFSPPHPRSKKVFNNKRMRSILPDKPNKLLTIQGQKLGETFQMHKIVKTHK